MGKSSNLDFQFLSVKLEAVNSRKNSSIKGFPSKEVSLTYTNFHKTIYTSNGGDEQGLSLFMYDTIKKHLLLNGVYYLLENFVEVSYPC